MQPKKLLINYNNMGCLPRA